MSTPHLDRAAEESFRAGAENAARRIGLAEPIQWSSLSREDQEHVGIQARAAVSAALLDDDDVIARTLDEHRASPATSPHCRCGWRPGMSLNDTEADRRQHRAHQADAVRAAILGEAS